MVLSGIISFIWVLSNWSNTRFGDEEGNLKHTCTFCIFCNARRTSSELVEVDFGFKTYLVLVASGFDGDSLRDDPPLGNISPMALPGHGS